MCHSGSVHRPSLPESSPLSLGCSFLHTFITGYTYMRMCFLSPQNVSPWGRDSVHLVAAVSHPESRIWHLSDPQHLLLDQQLCMSHPATALFTPSLRNTQPPFHRSPTLISEGKENNTEMANCPFRKGAERKIKFLEIQENSVVCRDWLAPVKAEVFR